MCSNGKSIILQWEILKVKIKIKSYVHSLTQNLKAEKGVKESTAFWIFFDQFDFMIKEMHSFVKSVSSRQLPIDTDYHCSNFVFSISCFAEKHPSLYSEGHHSDFLDALSLSPHLPVLRPETPDTIW